MAEELFVLESRSSAELPGEMRHAKRDFRCCALDIVTKEGAPSRTSYKVSTTEPRILEALGCAQCSGGRTHKRTATTDLQCFPEVSTQMTDFVHKSWKKAVNDRRFGKAGPTAPELSALLGGTPATLMRTIFLQCRSRSMCPILTDGS